MYCKYLRCTYCPHFLCLSISFCLSEPGFPKGPQRLRIEMVRNTNRVIRRAILSMFIKYWSRSTLTQASGLRPWASWIRWSNIFEHEGKALHLVHYKSAWPSSSGRSRLHPCCCLGSSPRWLCPRAPKLWPSTKAPQMLFLKPLILFIEN